MGSGYTCTCKKCGFVFNAHVGVGFNYPSLYQETLKAAKSGRLGKQVKSFITENPDGAIDPKLVIARCEECGKYDSVPDFSMYIPKEGHPASKSKGNWTVGSSDDIEYVFDFDTDYELKEKYNHKCKGCGGPLRIIGDKVPEHLPCPMCGGEMESEHSIFWD